MIKTSGRKADVAVMAPAVAEDIKRVLGRDPRLRAVEKVGLEFLLSMGLLVKDPSDRAKVLVESLNFACVDWRLRHGRAQSRVPSERS